MKTETDGKETVEEVQNGHFLESKTEELKEDRNQCEKEKTEIHSVDNYEAENVEIEECKQRLLLNISF